MDRERGPLGVVLAGGASRRLGRDKAAIVLGGLTSLERVRAALAAGVEEVVTVGGEHAEVPDLEAGGGPLQALIAAARWARAAGREGIVVLGCDLPLMDAATVRRLAAPLEAGCEARVPELGGERQWLAAHYGAAAIARLEAAWAAGVRSLKRAMAEARLDDAGAAGGWDEGAFLDIDTPEALAAVTALVEGGGS